MSSRIFWVLVEQVNQLQELFAGLVIEGDFEISQSFC
jgi:hypothetical protein